MKYPDDFDHILIEGFEQLDGLEKPIRVACLLHMLEAEVNNGGFDLFFFNSSGQFALQTLEALDTIGAPVTKGLLEAAIALSYPAGYPNDPSCHQETADYESVSESLHDLDRKFYEYLEPLADLVNQYLHTDA